MGSYITDFCCVEKKLVVEGDGGQHGEEGYEVYDRKRAEFLNGKGYRVLRFWHGEVLKDNPHPTLSLKKGRGEIKFAELKLHA